MNHFFKLFFSLAALTSISVSSYGSEGKYASARLSKQTQTKIENSIHTTLETSYGKDVGLNYQYSCAANPEVYVIYCSVSYSTGTGQQGGLALRFSGNGDQGTLLDQTND